MKLIKRVDINDEHSPNTLAFKFEIDPKDKCVNKSYYEVNLFERAVCIDSEMHSVFNFKNALDISCSRRSRSLTEKIKARKQQQASKNKFHLQMKLARENIEKVY